MTLLDYKYRIDDTCLSSMTLLDYKYRIDYIPSQSMEPIERIILEM